ncbi:MAG: LysM peptidoglycan-binding domain-containing protein [Anaerolineae bacterium]
MDLLVFARILLLSAVLAVSSPNVTPVTPAAGYTLYVVQSGDTLAGIARQFNTTTDQLTQVNHLAGPDALTPGIKLQVPIPRVTAATPTTYTVKAGDTLNAIATRLGVSVDDLAHANHLADVDTLAIGQVLIIPGQAASAPAGAPEGIALLPAIVKQGNTLEFKITAGNVVSATGSFASAPLQFSRVNGVLYALAGISRCAKLTTYPASINLITTNGQSTPVTTDIQVNATNYPVQDITLTPGMAALLDPAIEQAENNRVANTVAPFTPTAFWSGPFHPPLAVKDPIISALFGQRRSYNGGAVGLCGHEGQDFAVDGGTPAYAPAPGIVVLAQPLTVRGNVVFVNHGQGVYSGFYHLSEIDVKAGQVVKTGDLLGKVGTTGFSTGNHLHWSLWVDGVYVDPIEWENRSIP